MTEKLEEEIEDVVVGKDGVLIPESEKVKEEATEEELNEEEVNENIKNMATLLKDRSNASELDAINLRAEIAAKKEELENIKKSILVSANPKETDDKIKMYESMIKSSEYLLKYVLEAGIFNNETVTNDSNDMIRKVSEVLLGKKRLHSKQVNEIVMLLNGKKEEGNFDKAIERIKDVYVQKCQTFYNMRSKSGKSFIDALRLVDEKLTIINTEYFKIFENLDIGRLLYILRAILVIYFQYMIEEHLSRGGNKFKANSDKLDDCKVAAERFFMIMQANALSAERIKFLSNLVDFIIFAKGYPNPQECDARDIYEAGGFHLIEEREPLIKLQILVESGDSNLILTNEYIEILGADIERAYADHEKAGEDEIRKEADAFNDRIRAELKVGEFEEIN